jgi:hypothetical protein
MKPLDLGVVERDGTAPVHAFRLRFLIQVECCYLCVADTAAGLGPTSHRPQLRLVLRLSLEIELRQALEGIRVRPLVKREESFPKLGPASAVRDETLGASGNWQDCHSGDKPKGSETKSREVRPSRLALRRPNFPRNPRSVMRGY